MQIRMIRNTIDLRRVDFTLSMDYYPSLMRYN